MSNKSKEKLEESSKLDYLIDVSLDQKVDKFLIEYERTAVLGPPTLPGAQPAPTLGAQQQALTAPGFPVAPQSAQPTVQTSSVSTIKKLVESKTLPIVVVNKKDVFVTRLHENVRLPVSVVEPTIKQKMNQEMANNTVVDLDTKFYKFNVGSLPVQIITRQSSGAGLTALREAPGDDPAAEAPADPAADPTATPDPTADPSATDPTADPTATGEPKKENLPEKPKINLSLLTRSMARLITGYDYLIDPKRVIYNRCKAFIKINYGEQVAQQFEKILQIEFNIDPYTSTPGSNTVKEPFAAGSGGGDGGVSSGGS